MRQQCAGNRHRFFGDSGQLENEKREWWGKNLLAFCWTLRLQMRFFSATDDLLNQTQCLKSGEPEQGR